MVATHEGTDQVYTSVQQSGDIVTLSTEGGNSSISLDLDSIADWVEKLMSHSEDYKKREGAFLLGLAAKTELGNMFPSLKEILGETPIEM